MTHVNENSFGKIDLNSLNRKHYKLLKLSLKYYEVLSFHHFNYAFMLKFYA